MKRTPKTSRYLQAFFGIGLAFLVGAGAMAAQDKLAKPETATPPGTMASATTADKTYAPGLPGWARQLPADKQEAFGRIWLAEGRAYMGLQKMVKAKNMELDALLAMPGSDDKAVQALVKEIASYQERALNAEVALKRKLEKEGIPFWAHGMTGGSMKEGMSCPMMGGKGGGMGMGMMKGGDAGKAGDAPAPKDGGHSGH